MSTAPSLLEVQRAMLHSIALADQDAAVPVIVSDRVAAAERIAIYRNTAIGSLIKALRLSHPAAHRLVGADFFEGAAHQFLQQHWPRAALLDEFGADFGAFLQAFEPAGSLPYLGDVARLEWAVHRALHAIDAPTLDLARLAEIAQAHGPRVRLAAHPSLSLLQLGFPADSIWRAVLEEDDAALAAIDPAPTPLWVMVQRVASGGVDVRRLPEPEWRFAAALCFGISLWAALESTQRLGPERPAERLLAELLTAGCFVDFTVDSEGAQGPQIEAIQGDF
jgi:hypothetical protein